MVTLPQSSGNQDYVLTELKFFYTTLQNDDSKSAGNFKLSKDTDAPSIW